MYVCLCLQVYGPKGLGKLSAGGHPRHLAQDYQNQNQQQKGVHDIPKMQQRQDAEPVDNTSDNQKELHTQDQVVQGAISQDQLSQVQRSQEQHTQQQVKEQFSDGVAKGVAGGPRLKLCLSGKQTALPPLTLPLCRSTRR